MLVAQREDEPVVGRGRLQLEVERRAEPLAQRKAPRPVDPCAERRVQDELHPAAFIEEPLRHDRLLRRHDAQERLAG